MFTLPSVSTMLPSLSRVIGLEESKPSQNVVRFDFPSWLRSKEF